VALWPIYEEGPQPVDVWDVLMHGWSARQVFSIRPPWVLDVGSDTLFTAILSQFTPVTTIDIRPWSCPLPGLTVRQGDVLSLPYATASVPCVTCLSVIEHVGLGRYSDALDPQGSVKALRELWRVLAPGGHLVLAVPISHTAGVMFNAHRLLTRESVLSELPGCRVVEEVALYPQFGPVEAVKELGEWGYAMLCQTIRKESQ